MTAHSMGELLTKTVVADSGDQLWERTFHKPPADLALSATVREQLDRLLRFQRAPCITRVVFIAVPHRGSLLAENVAGRIGRMLIAVPATVLTPVRLLREQAGAALATEVKAALQEAPTSIKGLSPHNPMIQALAGVAIDKEVPFHSIIGDRGLGDGAQGSDGVVPYTSAHLAEAESEVIVPVDHAATAHPFTVLEVKWILRLHLLQAGDPGSCRRSICYLLTQCLGLLVGLLASHQERAKNGTWIPALPLEHWLEPPQGASARASC